jgi:hypothetical protein
MTVTRYDKTQSQWDVPKMVPRFLPWRVGQLMALYLTYVQPFMERLSVAVGYDCGWSEYIWADANGPWDTAKLTAVLKRRTRQDLEVELGTLDYRRVAVGIGRRFVGGEFARAYQEEVGEVEEPEIETDDPLEQSAGRTTTTGMDRYAVSKDIVKHLSQRSIDTFRALSESWHRFLGLASRKGDEGKRKRLAEEASAEMPARKRTKTPMTNTMVFGGLTTPMTGTSATSPAAWSKDSNPDPLPSSSPLMTPSKPPETRKVGRSERARAVRKALRLTGTAEVSYKSPQQEEALERIMDGKDPALAVVLPTDGGKTLLFTAPACLQDPEVTIVAVP